MKRWQVLLGLTAVFAVILLIEPRHNDLQTADNAADFVKTLDGHTTASTLAALCDVAFAAAYCAVGLEGLRIVGRGSRLAVVGSVLIAVGALCDEIENVFLIRNIANPESLTNGAVDLMQVPGTIKWVGGFGFLILFGLLIQRARQR